MSLPNLSHLDTVPQSESEPKTTETKDTGDISEAPPLVSVPTAPDGGYGWVVVCACFYINYIIDGIFIMFGVLMPAFIEYFGSGRAQTVLVGSVMAGTLHMSGPFVSILVNVLGCRVVAMAGGVCATIGLALSCFVPSVQVLTLTLGCITGLGFGLLNLPCVVVVSTYFEARRSLANGLSTAGAGVGMLTMAPITAFIYAAVGWRFTVLYVAGMTLHTAVCGALLRPVQGVMTSPDKVKVLAHADDAVQTPEKEDVINPALPRALSIMEPIAEEEIPGDYVHISLMNTLAGSVFDLKQSSADVRAQMAPPTAPRTAPIAIPGSAARYEEDLSSYGCSPGLMSTSDNMRRLALRNVAAHDNPSKLRKVSENSPVGSPVRQNSVFRTHHLNAVRSISAMSEVSSSFFARKFHGIQPVDLGSFRMYHKANPLSKEDMDGDVTPEVGSPPTKLALVKSPSQTEEVVKMYYSCIDLRRPRKSRKEAKLTDAEKKYHIHRVIIKHGVAQRPADTAEPMKLRTSQLHVSQALNNPLFRADAFFGRSISFMPPEDQMVTDGTQTPIVPVTQEMLQQVVTVAHETVCCCIPRRFFLTMQNMLDMSLLKNWTFLVIALANMFMQIGATTACIFLVDFGVYVGLSPGQSSSLSAIFGGCNTIARVVGGGLATLKCVNALVVVGGSFILAGVGCVLMVLFATNYVTAIIGAAAIGFFLGPPVPLTAIYMVQFLGLKNLTNAYGLLSLFKGISCLVGVPFAGWLLDSTGTYTATFGVACVFLVICGCLHLTFPFVDKLQQQRTLAGPPPPPGKDHELKTLL